MKYQISGPEHSLTNRSVTEFLLYAFDWHRNSEMVTLVGLSVFVGIFSGVSALVFRWLIEGFRALFFGSAEAALSFLGPYYVILVPAAGGLLVGPLIYFFAREAKGHGVPEVMLAVAERGGRIRPQVAVVKSLASSLCIGSGGSVGREGPIVQIGSTLGSALGQWLRLPDERIRTLVACGAAGGIAATFNAPIAGVFFAMEVILGEFATTTFSMVVLSSVTASIIARMTLGNNPAFAVPLYSMVSPWEIGLYFGLGLLAAPVAVAFSRILYAFEDLFDAWHIPEYLKPVPGGLAVGTMGLFFPELFGVGYDGIEKVFAGKLVLGAMLLLVFLKILATSITIGSGGSGGVFAPSLFIGVMLGGAYGLFVHGLFPTITASAGAYALVGMGAVFAAAAHAPITAIIILFEMTNDYRIILPLMTSVVVSVLVSHRLSRESIYTVKLIRRGIDIRARRAPNPMDVVTVGEAMTSDFEILPRSLSLQELAERFNRSGHRGFPVVDERGMLYGIVTLTDLENAMLQDGVAKLTVGDIASTDILVAYPDQTLHQALEQLSIRNVGLIPVVERGRLRKLVGILRRADIIAAYVRAAGKGRATFARDRERLRIGNLAGTALVEIELSPESSLDNRRVRELTLPEDSVLVAIRRDGRVIIPRGNTLLHAGDVLLALTKQECESSLRAYLQGS